MFICTRIIVEVAALLHDILILIESHKHTRSNRLLNLKYLNIRVQYEIVLRLD
jgi:hypothetical protein